MQGSATSPGALASELEPPPLTPPQHEPPGIPSSAAKSTTRRVAEQLAPFVGFGLFLAFWYYMSYWGMSEGRQFLVPPPHRVIDRSFLDNAKIRGDLLHALWLSTQVAAVGLFIAIVIGMTTATVMSRARWIERMIWPFAVALQAIPILAFVPLIGAFFDFNFRARVLVCVIISVFPIIANTFFGLISADPGQHDLFTLHNAGSGTRLLKLQYPAALPQIFTGLRISAGLSVIGAVVGDFFFRQGEPGIGRAIDVYRSRNQTPEMYGAVILTAVLGIAVFFLFNYLSKVAVGRWHESTGQS
jgi:NitT/TauT family transport system permease protein